MAFGASANGFGVSFTLVDNFTNVANKIKGSYKGLSDTAGNVNKGLNAGISELKNNLGAIVGSGAVLMGLSQAVQASAQLSDKLADVTKASGLAGAELEQFRMQLQELDTRTSLNELIDISIIGGKLGIAKNELLEFTKAVDMAVVSLGDEFSGGAEEVATKLGKLQKLFKQTADMKVGEAMTKIGSSLNYLGSAGSATGNNIAEFTTRIGQLGTMAPSIADTMGLGSALEELGLNAEIASGGVTNILTTATNKTKEFSMQMGMSVSQVENLINTSPNEFFLKLAESFKGMKNADIGQALKDMGIGSQEAQKVMLQLSNNIDLVRQRQEQSNKAFKEGTSLAEEFAVKNMTLQAVMDKATKRFNDIKLEIGEALKPIVEKLAIAFEHVLLGVKAFISTPIGKFFFFVAVAGLAFLTTMTFIGAIIPPLTTAFTAFGISVNFALWPIVAIAAGVIALGLVLSKLSKMIKEGDEKTATWGATLMWFIPVIGPIITMVTSLTRGIEEFNKVQEGADPKKGFLGFLTKIGGVFTGVMEIWRSATSEGFALSEKTKNALEKMGILQFVLNLGTWIVRIKEMFRGIGDFFGEHIGKPLKEAFGFLSQTFEEIRTAIVGGLEEIGFNVDKLGGSMETFRTIGQVVGAVLGGVFSTIAYIIKGVSWGIMKIVQGIITFIKWIKDAIQWVKELVSEEDKAEQKRMKIGKSSVTRNIVQKEIQNNILKTERQSTMITDGVGKQNDKLYSAINKQGSNKPIVQTVIELDGEVVAKAVNKHDKNKAETYGYGF